MCCGARLVDDFALKLWPSKAAEARKWNEEEIGGNICEYFLNYWPIYRQSSEFIIFRQTLIVLRRGWNQSCLVLFDLAKLFKLKLV